MFLVSRTWIMAHLMDLLEYQCQFLLFFPIRLISLIPSMAVWLSVLITTLLSEGAVQRAVNIAASSALVDEGHLFNEQLKAAACVSLLAFRRIQ